MRALFGVVSLLVVLAIVAILAMKQLKAVGTVAGVTTLPASAGNDASGTVREQSQQLQKRVESDVVRALEQGAAARRDEPGQ